MEKKEQLIKEQKKLEKWILILSIVNLIVCLLMKFANGDKVIILAIVLGIIWIFIIMLIYMLNDYYYKIHIDDEQKQINVMKKKTQVIIGLIYSVFMIIWMFNCFR